MLIPKTVNDLPHPHTLTGAKLELVSTENNILAYAYGEGKVFKFSFKQQKIFWVLVFSFMYLVSVDPMGRSIIPYCFKLFYNTLISR